MSSSFSVQKLHDVHDFFSLYLNDDDTSLVQIKDIIVFESLYMRVFFPEKKKDVFYQLSRMDWSIIKQQYREKFWPLWSVWRQLGRKEVQKEFYPLFLERPYHFFWSEWNIRLWDFMGGEEIPLVPWKDLLEREFRKTWYQLEAPAKRIINNISHPLVQRGMHLAFEMQEENPAKISRLMMDFGYHEGRFNLPCGLEEMIERELPSRFTSSYHHASFLLAKMVEKEFSWKEEKNVSAERLVLLEIERIKNHLNLLANVARLEKSYLLLRKILQVEKRVLDLEAQYFFHYQIRPFQKNNFFPERPGLILLELNKIKEIVSSFKAPCSSRKISFNEVKMMLEEGLTGPILRSVGINLDLRNQKNYLLYNRYAFKEVLSSHKNIGAIFHLFVQEILSSMSIIDGILGDYPSPSDCQQQEEEFIQTDDFLFDKVEAPMGELSCCLKINADKVITHLHFTSPHLSAAHFLTRYAPGKGRKEMEILLALFNLMPQEIDILPST